MWLKGCRGEDGAEAESYAARVITSVVLASVSLAGASVLVGRARPNEPVSLRSSVCIAVAPMVWLRRSDASPVGEGVPTLAWAIGEALLIVC